MTAAPRSPAPAVRPVARADLAAVTGGYRVILRRVRLYPTGESIIRRVFVR
jgi:hypothetical protein